MRRNAALAIVATTPAADPVFAAIEQFNEAADAYWMAAAKGTAS